MEEEYRKFPSQQNENPLKEAHIYEGLLCPEGENIQEETVMMMVLESCRDWRPPERGRYPNQGGRPPDQGGYPDRGPPGDEGPPGTGYPHRNGRPPGRGVYPGRTP